MSHGRDCRVEPLEKGVDGPTPEESLVRDDVCGMRFSLW